LGSKLIMKLVEPDALSLEETRKVTEQYGINQEITEKSHSKRDRVSMSVRPETYSYSSIRGTIIQFMTPFFTRSGEAQK